MRRLVPLLLVLSACTRPGTSSAPASSTSPPVATEAPPLAAVTSAEPPAPPAPTGPWREALRGHRWQEARKAIEALPAEERGRPELRLALAKAARMLGDHRAVLEQTEGLRIELVAGLIERFRAEAALEVGPHEEAAAYYGAQGGSAAAFKAGLALERAGKGEEALRLLERAASGARGESQEAQARGARARILAALGRTREAVAEARWVVLQAPSHGKEALELVKKLDPTWSPSGQERLERARKLAQAGQAPEALAELGAAEPLVPASEWQRERGQVLYKLRRYGEAAEVLGQVARRSRSQGDAFQAARALSRAHRDAEAIDAYRKLIEKDARSPLAEEASYLSARLSLLLGRNEDADRLYGSYLRKFRKGKFHRAATYERALAQVAAGKYTQAREAFGSLARSEDSAAEGARLRELEGVAALKAGDKEGAQRLLEGVIREQPLSWPALMARERLVQLGVNPPMAPESQPEGASTPLEVKLPAAARWLQQLGLDEEAEEALQREEKGVEGAHPGRSAEALCEAYGQLDTARRRYRVGQNKVKLELIQKAPGFSNRWAWGCLYPTPYAAPVREAEQQEKLESGLLHAVMRQESAFDPAARSPALAEGLLQLLPSTAREVARRNQVPYEDGTLQRPAVNIDLGARYLAMLLRMWKGNLVLSVASYNAGPQAVSRWLAHHENPEADLWVARIPYGETRTYVARVLGNLARYAYLSGGEERIPRILLPMDGTLKAEEGAF
jgi:soluble lytic murein transglycosylase